MGTTNAFIITSYNFFSFRILLPFLTCYFFFFIIFFHPPVISFSHFVVCVDSMKNVVFLFYNVPPTYLFCCINDVFYISTATLLVTFDNIFCCSSSSLESIKKLVTVLAEDKS